MQDKPRRQCRHCPWKVSVNPHTIPNGYSVEKHKALVCTIATPGQLPTGTLRIMACHQSTIGDEVPCVGWLHNQLGVGNNITLRLAVRSGLVDPNVKVVGPQHKSFADTIVEENL